MINKQNIFFKAAKVFLLLSIMLPLSANAQISGQRINPDVIFMIDTGTGMNWLKPADPNTTLSSGERTELSAKACDNMNLPKPSYTHEKTSWQTLLEATLGSSTQIEYQHCFYEEPAIRPYIHDDTITGLTETDQALYQKMHDYTDEYWKNNREPHMRIVNCFDPRKTGNRGDWNEQYQQCIGADISSIPAHIIHEGLRDYWCQDTVDGKANYVTTTDGDEICFNYHPKALPRTTDGILERYRSLARFSVMTFDNLPGPTEVDAATWDLDTQHRAGWDFGPNREWYMSAYEQRDGSTGTRAWNAGIRGDYSAAVGKLVKISNDIEYSNSEVRKVLDTVEPLHCSFDAAFFDDMGEYVYNASEIRPAYSTGSDLYFNCRPKLVIFISDGIQTDAVEFPQNYCAKDNKQPPPPWPAPYTPPTAATGPYTCPFNSTSTEANEAFHVVDKIASSAGASISDVDPMYLVVIGLNMKDKEAGPGNRCDGDPTWVSSPQGDYCKPPGDDCVSIDEVPLSECVATSAVYKAAYLTPRQYLNTLALSGWPDPSMPGGTIAPYVDTSTGGTFIQPPWRGTTPAVDWCTTKPNMCGGEDGDGMPDGALFVDNRDDLSAVLDTILNGFKYDDTATRTELATTNIVNDFSSIGGSYISNTDNVKQYVFNSGYRSVAGEPWQGVLNRQGYKCTQKGDTTGGAIASEFKDFQTALKTQGGDNRKIYTIDRDFDETTVTCSDDNFEKGMTSVVSLIDSSDFDDCDLGLPTPFCKGNKIYFNKVVEYLKGVPGIGKRAEYPLGDIYNSSPFILPPPRERIPFDSYQTFRSLTYKDFNGADHQNFDRQPYLYVGTNDGILHSFNVWAKNPSNIEGWGFVPTPLVQNLDLQFPIKWKNTYTQTNLSDPMSWVVDGYDIFTEDDDEAGAYQHTFGVDAPPIAADVLLYKDGSSTESKWWRSVVIGSLGKGGYGYYCLDVTANPESKPAYRWQLSHTNYGGNSHLEDTTGWDQADIDALNAKKLVTEDQFKEMGLGLSRPELAYVYYDTKPPKCGAASTPHQAAVAILPGGYLNDESHGIETSTGVYIVRVADGRLERYLKPDVDTDLCDPDSLMFESNLYPVPSSGAKPKAKVAQLVGQPIVPNGIRTGKVADEAFIGDDRGRVWRIDMSSKDPADWCLEVFFDTMLADHFPYKDCLNSTASTPGNSKCCDEKDSSVGNSCSQSDIDAFMTDSNIGIDDCSGAACTTPDFPFPRIMMLAPPTIVQDEDRNNVLLFGTGEIDGLDTINHNRVFSVTVTPTITVGADTAAVSRSLPTINWWLGEDIGGNYPVGKHTNTSAGLGYIEAQMYPSSGDSTLAPSIASTYFDYWGIGEKMLGRISVFDKTAYFVSFTPLEKSTAADYLDACNGGGGKIWGVNFNDLSDFPKLPDESGLGGPDVSYYERDNQLLTGLRLVRRPGCEGTEGFVLMVQKAQPPAGQSANPGNSDNAAPITSETVSISGGNRGFTRVGIDSWSIVLGGK